MFSALEIFGIHKKSNFSRCWLAATNPKILKKLVLRGETDQIGISILCDELRVELNTGLMSSSNGVPLYFAAQMVYGAVRIYQQQVQTLYEKTNHLICYQHVTVRDLKRCRNSDETNHGKKQKLPLDLAEDAKQYEIDLPDTKGEDVCQLLSQDTHTGNPQDLLIHEEMQVDITDDDEDEDLGVINGNELEILSALDDALSANDSFKGHKNEEEEMQKRSQGILNEDRPTQILDNGLHEEIELIREAVREEGAVPLMLGMPDIYDPNNSIQIESVIENMRSFGLQSPLIENMDTGGDQPNAAVVPDQPGPLDDVTLAELIGSKRKPKTFKLVDECIRIPKNKMEQRIRPDSSLRCFSARMDIVTRSKMRYKDSKKLFNMSASNLRSKQLLKAFRSKLNTKETEVDAKILDDILGTESANFEEVINPVIPCNARTPALRPENDVNRRSKVDKSFAETTLPPFEVTNALEITTNALETAGQPDIIHMNSQLSEPNNSLDDFLYLRLKEDLLRDFKGEEDEQEDSNPRKYADLNRSQLGKLLLIRRLVHLWKNKVDVITMQLLCDGNQRKDAAYAFLCLLELRARHYIELKRDVRTNEIYSIELGVKLLDRLNGTFK